MSNISEIIRQIYKDLSCPACGKNYRIGQLSIRGLFDKTLLVQTICSSGHFSLFMTSLKHVEQIKSLDPISTDDCIDIHKNIKNFNGDFIKLWKK